MMQVVRRDDKYGVQLLPIVVQQLRQIGLVGRRLRAQLAHGIGIQFIILRRWLANDADVSPGLEHNGQVVARHSAGADGGNDVFS